jgi:hypothetical protein|tara:strand:+ start:804 stop:1424 length:621 start_codon:yes stop_codon:yes gene_type:complete
MTKKVKKGEIRKKKVTIKPIQKKIKIKIIKSSDKIKELKRDKSGLKESIEELEEDFNENKFIGFLQPSTKSTTPVLERVADAPQQAIRLEQDIADVSTSEKTEENKLNYVMNSNESNYALRREGTGYQSNEIATQPERINTETAGRNLRPAIRDADTINPGFQRTKSVEYVKQPGQLERTTPTSPHEQRKTEAHELESRMEKYESR